MADAAWAELQAGESGARDKAWDRILKKNAVAKKAKKKRPPKRWEPPVAPVAAKEEPAHPPAPPETAPRAPPDARRTSCAGGPGLRSDPAGRPGHRLLQDAPGAARQAAGPQAGGPEARSVRPRSTPALHAGGQRAHLQACLCAAAPRAASRPRCSRMAKTGRAHV